MNELHDLWNSPTAGYWLLIAWQISAAGWFLLSVLWGIQVWWCAVHDLRTATVVHSLKLFAGLSAFFFFLLSILWRTPDPVITWGAWSRNLVGWLVVFTLFIEAVWRLREKVRRDVEQHIRETHA